MLSRENVGLMVSYYTLHRLHDVGQVGRVPAVFGWLRLGGCRIAAQKKTTACGHNSLSLVRQGSPVMRHSPVSPANGAGAGSATVRAHRPGPAPRPRVVDACAALAGVGFGVIVGTVILGEDRGSLAAPGGLLTAAGRLAGFTGAYLMLIMVVLVARLPWLEVSVGQDRLVSWHRQVAPWAFGLIAAHVALITLGYAQAAKAGCCASCGCSSGPIRTCSPRSPGSVSW
jgi:hypothetical protein